MRFTVASRRPARRTVAVFLAGFLLAMPAAAIASHQFPDVPTGHPFHTEIGAIAEAGVTAGFDDGGYHPSDAVTRQAMAAFMHRGFGRVAISYAGTLLTASVTALQFWNTTDVVPLRAVTINVPGATNAFSPNQIVHLHARAVLHAAMGPNAGCPCVFVGQIRDEATDTIFMPQFATFESDSNGGYHHGFDIEALFEASPGDHTYTLEVGLFDREGNVNEATFPFNNTSTLTATTFPFGPGGTSDSGVE